MNEPVGRFAAVHTINRGLREAPVLRQGLAITWVTGGGRCHGTRGRADPAAAGDRPRHRHDRRRAGGARRRAGGDRRRGAGDRRRGPAPGRGAPRSALRAGALRPAHAPHLTRPPDQLGRPQRGAPRGVGGPGDERHRDAGPVLPVGRPGLAARRTPDPDGLGRDAGLRLDPRPGRLRRRGPAGDRPADRAAPPRRGLRASTGTQRGDAGHGHRDRDRRRDDARLRRR